MKIIIRVTCLLAAITLTGCAKQDPFEGYNRVAFAFNEDVDHLAFRPIAKTYKAVTPVVLQKGVTNVFENLGETTTFPNDLLQGHFKYLAVDFWRFVINTTLGVGGLFDIATRIGIHKHVETFGLTFAKWSGGKDSPYLILPVLGSYNIQNAIGLIPTYYTTPFAYIDNDTWTYAAAGLRYTEQRAKLLAADKMVETAFDPYIFVRNAYIQHNRHKIDENQNLGKSGNGKGVQDLDQATR